MSSPPWLSELQRLDHLQDDLSLLPVGWGNDKKGPMLNDWQKHLGFTVEQLQSHYGIRSAGARTGLFTGPLIAYDFDGETSLNLGLYPWEFISWHVHRDNDPFRLKVLAQPTPEQISQLPDQTKGGIEFQGKTITAPKQGDAKCEALEVFFDGGRQVVILGDHPSTGGNYFWPDGLGPEQLAPPPDNWWTHTIAIAQQQVTKASTGSQPSANRNGKRRLNPCPICGRHAGKGGSSLWCDETSTGLILCMPGSTFSAEQSHGELTVGQSVVQTSRGPYALVKRTGDVLTFKPHQERHPKHRRAMHNLVRVRAGATV